MSPPGRRSAPARGAGRCPPTPPTGRRPATPWSAPILASATPDRDDRLFPGDIAQFGDGGGLGLAHGAAGVLYALAQAGAERYEEGERWLLRHLDPAPQRRTARPVRRAGRRRLRTRPARPPPSAPSTWSACCLDERWQRLAPTCTAAWPASASYWTTWPGSPARAGLRERADAGRPAGRPADRQRHAGRRITRRTDARRHRPGPAVPARCTSDRATRSCSTWRPPRCGSTSTATSPGDNGALDVDEGWRTMPYLGDGSVGIGLVLDDFLRAPAGRGVRAGPAAAS